MNSNRKIASLLRKQEKNKNYYFNLIGIEEKKRNQEAVECLISEYQHEDALIETDIDELRTFSLISEAKRLLLPIPENHGSKYWKKVTFQRGIIIYHAKVLLF